MHRRRKKQLAAILAAATMMSVCTPITGIAAGTTCYEYEEETVLQEDLAGRTEEADKTDITAEDASETDLPEAGTDMAEETDMEEITESEVQE